jgi:ABC-type histidine transport system ATPase subunit
LLSRGELKPENESGIIATQDEALQIKDRAKIIFKTKPNTNADCVNMTIGTIHQRAQYWQRTVLNGNVMECVIKYPLTYARI